MDIDIDNEKLVLDVDGKSKEYRILFTFDSEDTMKSYIGYTDDSVSEDGRKNIYVSSYNPASDDNVLENITDQKELDMVNDVLKQIYKDSKQEA